MVTLYDARNRPIDPAALRRDLEPRFASGNIGWERITDGTQVDPLWVANAIKQMERGNTRDFVLLVYRIIERFPAAGAALSRLTDAMGFAYRTTPASDKRTDTKVGEAIRRVVEGDPFIRNLKNVRDAITVGYSVTEMRWQEVAGWFVPVAFKRVKPEVIEWLDDGETPVLKVGWTYERLQPDRFIAHTSSLRAGLPVNVGIGKTLAYIYLFYTLAMASYSGYGERYGMPWIKGTHPTDAPREYVEALKEAARTLGTEASVIMDDRFELEIMDAMANNNTATGQFFYDFVRLLDKQAHVAVVGFDMTDTNGGSRALGEVLERLLRRRIRSLAWEEAATMRAQLVDPVFRYNVSENLDKERPRLDVDIENDVDFKALAEGLGPLIDRGLQVTVAEVLDRCGLPVPDGMDPRLMMVPLSAAKKPEALDSDVRQQAATELKARLGAEEKARGYAEAILKIVDAVEDVRDKRALGKRIRAIARESGLDVKQAA